nr:MAG TPA: hypothetical protein [Caudoviricetes sp.]
MEVFLCTFFSFFFLNACIFSLSHYLYINKEKSI